MLCKLKHKVLDKLFPQWSCRMATLFSENLCTVRKSLLIEIGIQTHTAIVHIEFMDFWNRDDFPKT